MDKQIAIVTGGGSGLGLAITHKLVKEGIHTVIIGRNEDKLKEVAEELGHLCSYQVFDLQNLAGIPAIIDQIHAEFGKIDILVNNAGINMKKPFTEVTDEDFAAVIQTNLSSVFAISREVVKKMLFVGAGSIVNISSMAAQYVFQKLLLILRQKPVLKG